MNPAGAMPASAASRALFAAQADIVIKGDGLRTNEATLEVGVDHAGGFGCRGAAPDRPGPCLLGAHREECQQFEECIALADHPVQSGLLEIETGEIFAPVVERKVGKFGLDGCRHDDMACA